MHPVTKSQQGNITRLTIDDGKANAFTREIIESFESHLDCCLTDTACDAIIITGRPKFLSAGFDLATMQRDHASATELVEAGGQLMLRLYDYPKPIIIAAPGHAMAMGAILLFAGDYRIGASGPYKIGLNESAIGLNLPWIAIHLAEEKLAKKYVDRIIAGAEIITPKTAVEVGFFDEIVNPETLEEKALKEASRLASLDSKAYAENKRRRRYTTSKKLKEILAKEGGFW